MNLAKTYTPNEFEPNIYAMWESAGVFKPTGQGTPYSIVMPPPNANGNLHVGHALGSAIQDILVRYHRMKGDDAVYIPGADHAGFETWVVYERELDKQGKSRFDYSRDELYAQVWDFVDKKRGDMELQLRALGVGADWDDLVFTLDQKVIDTVYGTFEKMWSDGLIYRGERIVNFCPKHQTSFADIEVEYETEKSKLWKIAYPLLNHIGEIVVATTRPETMLGDTAIAVNPNDARYAKLIGTKALLPLVNREIPIVADEYVDMNYGTGAVKITPAHDPNDFEIGQRHDLPTIQIVDINGTMMNVPDEFVGLSVDESRQRVLEALEKEEFLRGEESIEHSVGHCYKCGTVIQPMVKEQWFVRMQPLAEKAIAAIEQGEVAFTPANKSKVLVAYLRELKDWNISRQIPWGIPIPAFQNIDDPTDWIFDTRVDQQEIVVNGTTYKREEDTLDTWFSSGQWPYITTDYLSGGQLAKFYPNQVMETAGDILFAWVARMIMLGVYRTGQVPFRHVYLHGLVLDEHGQKMSKSKGNVINPMEAISQYGSDALRMGIIASRSAAQPQAFNAGKVVAARNFCNKLWNIARFVEAQVGQARSVQLPEPQSMADHWVVRQLGRAGTLIEQQIAEYRFAEAFETLYHVVWDDVADWYIEASKVETHTDMLVWVLDTCLRLAHPFAPFVTETIWQALSWHDDLVAQASYPSVCAYNELQAAEFSRLKKLVAEARYVMSELPGNDRYTLLYGDDSLIAENTELVRRLARLKEVKSVDTARGLRLAASGRDAWLDVSEEVLYEHQTNLEKRLVEARAQAAKLQGRLDNERYVSQAPAHLVEESRQQLKSTQGLIERLVNELDVIG